MTPGESHNQWYQYYCSNIYLFNTHADPEGGTGGQDPHPPEKSQNIGFHSNTGPNPLKYRKATKPAFNDGPSLTRHQNAI